MLFDYLSFISVYIVETLRTPRGHVEKIKEHSRNKQDTRNAHARHTQDTRKAHAKETQGTRETHSRGPTRLSARRRGQLHVRLRVCTGK